MSANLLELARRVAVGCITTLAGHPDPTDLSAPARCAGSCPSSAPSHLELLRHAGDAAH